MLYTESKPIFYRKLDIYMLTGLKGKCHVCHVNVYFTDQNIMQTEDPIELNFEGL